MAMNQIGAGLPEPAFPEHPDLLRSDAGVATFNLAVDAVDVKAGLPKALTPIRHSFDYLVAKQYRYGYSVFLNINICRNNLDDVRELTETDDWGIGEPRFQGIRGNVD